MYQLKLFLTISFLAFLNIVNAQKSFIRGTVFDETLGEPLMGVTIIV